MKERDYSFFLVTRPCSPYNHTNDGQGVVRVIQYVFDDPQYNSTINASFLINGTRLFTNATEARSSCRTSFIDKYYQWPSAVNGLW